MVNFCKNAREFMSADDKNVIALHCKGGKGRTGTMICVWLVECGIFEDAAVRLRIYSFWLHIVISFYNELGNHLISLTLIFLVFLIKLSYLICTCWRP